MAAPINDRFIPRDEGLRPYATDRQWEVLEAYWDAGSGTAAAEKLGISENAVNQVRLSVRRRAAKHGYDPQTNHSHTVPPGFRLRGTSTLFDAAGQARLQWVKTTADQEALELVAREMAAALREDLPRFAAPESTPLRADPDPALCAVYPVGDAHLGMYAWDEEAGENYDLAIGDRLLGRAVSALVGAALTTGQALVVILGDLFHYDSLEPVTPSHKNLLDSDGRYAKMIRVGVRVVRRTIGEVLKASQTVRIIPQPGNHDPSTMVFLAECLSVMYEKCPQVSIDNSPGQYHYHRFGQNLVGVCHGHSVKLEQLPLIMATDRPADWGQTRHRYWYTGHTHKDRVLDVQGVRVESFRAVNPLDAWAATAGYRTSRELRTIVLHEEHGEVQRTTVRPEMFK